MKKKLLICGLVLALVALCGGGYYFYQKHHAVILYKQAEKAHQEEAYGQSLALYKELEQNYLSYLPLYDRLMVLFHMGSCFYFDGKYESAIPFYSRAVEKMDEKKVYGKDYTLLLYTRLSRSLLYTGKHSDAEKVLLQGYGIIRRIYGNGSSALGLMSARLGEVYCCSYEYKKSLPYWIRAIENKNFMIAQSESSKALIFVDLASVYLYIGRYDCAEQYYKKFFAYAQKSFGEYSANTAAGYAGYAMLYYKQQKIEKAILLLNKSYLIYKKIYGETHRNTLKVKEPIDRWTLENNKSKE